MQRGVISLGIGLAFLAVACIAAELLGRLIGDSHYRTLLREGLLIFGWVAVWRPLEIFLYDWWPILGQQRMHDRLSRIKVRIIYSGAGSPRSSREIRGSGPESAPIQ